MQLVHLTEALTSQKFTSQLRSHIQSYIIKDSEA